MIAATTVSHRAKPAELRLDGLYAFLVCVQVQQQVLYTRWRELFCEQQGL